MSRNERVSCESCTYYIYDEDYESYVCDRSLFPVSILQKW